MAVSSYIKNGSRISGNGSYHTDDNGKVQSATLKGNGLTVDLTGIENVVGSAGNDNVTLNTTPDKNLGIINLGKGVDTLHLGQASEYTLKLTGVETVTGVLGSTLNIRGAATFSTNGSVSITSSARDAGKQNITFTDLVNDITINLGTGKDVIKFGEGFSFLQNGDGELLVSKGGKTLTVEGYATNSKALTIEVEGHSYSYAALLGSELIGTLNGPATIAEINAIVANGGVLAEMTYSLNDTAAALAAAGATGNGAINVTANTAATVLEAAAILALTNSGTTTYGITDTATNVDSADAVTLNGATAITATGTAGADNINLSDNANGPVIVGVTIDLQADDDVFVGGNGADTITGGAGNDNLTGGNGNDTFVVDSGTDTITDWGTGTDVVQVAGGATAQFAAVTGGINVNTGGSTNAGSIVLTSSATSATSATAFVGNVAGGGTVTLNLTGTSFEDNIFDDGALVNVNTINITNASVSNQWFKFDDQNDGFNINVTSTVHVYVEGSKGNDSIVGGNAGETIMGNNGNDIISGGAGADVITGGNGQDTFDVQVSRAVTGELDQITDFTGGVGGDILKLSTAIMGFNVNGNQADFSTAADVVSSGNTMAHLVTDLQAAVAAQIVLSPDWWAQVGDTMQVTITGASVAGNDVTYIIQNNATDATFDAAADIAVALVGTSTLVSDASNLTV